MLSLAPRPTTENDVQLEEDTEYMMEVMVNHFPATWQRLSEYACAQVSDPVCSQIYQYSEHGGQTKWSQTLNPIGKAKGN